MGIRGENLCLKHIVEKIVLNVLRKKYWVVQVVNQAQVDNSVVIVNWQSVVEKKDTRFVTPVDYTEAAEFGGNVKGSPNTE